jgi:hypothetical protein
MNDHGGRRRLLYAAVTMLEPYASAGIIQHYVALKNDLTLPLLRIYVDLERLTKEGQLVRHVKPRLGGTGTTWFWETPGLVLVEPDRTPPRLLTAEAPMLQGPADWPGDDSGNFVHLMAHLAGVASGAGRVMPG